MDINKVVKDIAHVSSGVTPIYAHCETIQEIVQHLSEIRNIDGVEDAWTDDQTLYVKINDWGTLTYMYISEDEPFDNVFAQEVPSKIMSRTKSENNSSSHQDYTEEIRNMCVINQQYRDEDPNRDGRRKAETTFINLCDKWGFKPTPINDPSPQFFVNDIYDYDFVFLMTHGGYDKKTGLHWIYTGEQLYVGNEEGFVDESVMELKAREILEKKYPLSKEIDIVADYLSIGSYKEIRNGVRVPVFYTKISNKWIALGAKKFNHLGKAIVFNTACQSLMGNDEEHDNDNLAKAFFKRGAGLYIGYNQESSTGHIAGNGILFGLINGKSSYASFLSIPKRYSDYTFYSKAQRKVVHPVLKYKLNPIYEYDICLTHPETFDAKYSTESSYYKLDGEMHSYMPLCNFYSNGSCNDEVLKNTYGFCYSKNSDMTDAKKIDVSLFSDDISYDSQKSLLKWNVVLEGKDLLPNTTYYYCAYMNDGYSDCYGEIKTIGSVPYCVLKDGMLTFYYDGKKKVRDGLVFDIDNEYYVNSYDDGNIPKWREYYDKIITSSIDVSFKDYYPKSTAFWFDGCYYMTQIQNLEYLNTDSVTTMKRMFTNCSSLTRLDLSSFNTSNVTDMTNMFDGCESLKELDLSHFNTENVTDMHRMFYWCFSLEKINLSSFKTSKVTDMAGMFSNCRSLKDLDVSCFDTSNLIDMSGHKEPFDGYGNYDGMFAGCASLTSLDLSNFDTSKVTYMHQLFQNCTNLKEINMSGFVFKNTRSYNTLFTDCDSLRSINFSNGKIIGNAERLFSVELLKEINLSDVDTSEATDLSFLFGGCKSLKSLDLSSFNTANVSAMIGMFGGCDSLINLNISNFTLNDNIIQRQENGYFNNWLFGGDMMLETVDLSNAKIVGEAGAWLFEGLTTLKTLILDNIDTSEATNMSYMFYDCNSLKTIDLSNFNTANVTNMSYMFSGCNSLKTLDLSNFNTANVTQMKYMISCKLLENLNINNFVIVQYQDPIGYGNTSLKSISMCNGKVIGKGAEKLFSELYRLENVYLDQFDTSEATSLRCMFAGCSSLVTIDLTSFNVHKVNNFSGIFSGCRSLVTIYAGNWYEDWDWRYFNDVDNLDEPSFYRCDNLVGGEGTKIGYNYVYEEDGSYWGWYQCDDSYHSLHIDGGKDHPGLFTAK